MRSAPRTAVCQRLPPCPEMTNPSPEGEVSIRPSIARGSGQATRSGSETARPSARRSTGGAVLTPFRSAPATGAGAQSRVRRRSAVPPWGSRTVARGPPDRRRDTPPGMTTVVFRSRSPRDRLAADLLAACVPPGPWKGGAWWGRPSAARAPPPSHGWRTLLQWESGRCCDARPPARRALVRSLDGADVLVCVDAPDFHGPVIRAARARGIGRGLSARLGLASRSDRRHLCRSTHCSACSA